MKTPRFLIFSTVLIQSVSAYAAPAATTRLLCENREGSNVYSKLQVQVDISGNKAQVTVLQGLSGHYDLHAGSLGVITQVPADNGIHFRRDSGRYVSLFLKTYTLQKGTEIEASLSYTAGGSIDPQEMGYSLTCKVN